MTFTLDIGEKFQDWRVSIETIKIYTLSFLFVSRYMTFCAISRKFRNIYAFYETIIGQKINPRAVVISKKMQLYRKPFYDLYLQSVCIVRDVQIQLVRR